MNELFTFIDALLPELTALRRDLHRHPENAWCEIRTSSKIAAYLQALGYQVLTGEDVCDQAAQAGLPDEETLAAAYQWALDHGAEPALAARAAGGRTGVIGILDCGEGPTVALRYDMDALPILEDDGPTHRPAREGYRSVNEGMMHACGHDGHITVGLGVAKALIQCKDRLHGKVKLIFQPAEEGLFGARTIVAKGHLDDVDYAMGSHLAGQPDTKPGIVMLGTGATLASYKFDADLFGAPAHAGFAPNEGRNALLAASSAILNLHAIARHGEGDTRINVGVIRSGSARNIIAPHAHLEGEVRGTTQKAVDFMWKRVECIIHSAAEMHECTAELRRVGDAGVNENSPALTARLLTLCRENGIDCVDAGVQQARASEDFAWMAHAVQGHGGQSCYFNLLSACSADPHQSGFDFDERALPEGVKTYVSAVLELLK